MTGIVRCTDNAYIERLWRAFKYEGSYLYQWNTVEDLVSIFLNGFIGIIDLFGNKNVQIQ